MTNDDTRDTAGSASTTPAQPFVAPIPGLGAFTPAPNPSTQVAFDTVRSRWLLMPLAFWTVGLIQRDTSALAIALGAWVLSYPIYGAWSLWRIKDRDPRADLWRPIALLVLGSVPLLGFIPLLAVHSEAAYAVLILVAYLAGISALFAARSSWPKRHVRTLMAAAAAACFAWAAVLVAATLLIAVGASGSRPTIYDVMFGGLGVAVALADTWLGVGLTRAAGRSDRAA